MADLLERTRGRVARIGAVVKRNIILVRYSFERVAKLFIGG